MEVDTKNSQMEETLSRVNNEADHLRAKVTSLELKISTNSAESQVFSQIS